MLALKALHIIFVVTWFAGLFYVVRLFVYHTETSKWPEPERRILSAHFKIAARRLWYGITFPSMILTWILGLATSYSMFGWDFPKWLWIKLAFVAGLTIYHFICHSIFRNLQQDKVRYTSSGLRKWNEVTTVFLFAIVFIVVLKFDGTHLFWFAAALLMLILLLYFAFVVYKKIREKED